MRRLGLLALAVVVLVAIGTVGFVVLEGVSLGYGLEWTLDTITTVGSIPEPHNAGGRALKVVLELLGIGTLFYGLVTVAEFFVSGELNGVLEERRIQKTIDSYRDHFIVCGFGRVGRQVVRDLRAAGASTIVIDLNPENREIARDLGVPFIESGAADDDVLKAAGIERAQAVLACVDSDAENIFITLTARELRADILIVARAAVEETEKKLLRAGADRVISPYKISGAEIARRALRPQVGGALALADLRVEEIEVTPGCSGVGSSVGAVGGRAAIVALRTAGGELYTQPDPETTIGPGDTLVLLGSPDELERLEGLFQPARA